MGMQKVCISCRLQNKLICGSISPELQYCSDFTLFDRELSTMTTTNNYNKAISSSNGMQKDSSEWLFPGHSSFGLLYEKDNEIDLEAVVDESDYFSSQSTQCNSTEHTLSSRKLGSGTSVTPTVDISNYAKTAASARADFRSDMVDHIAHDTKEASDRARDESSSDKHCSPLFDLQISGPSPLEVWQQTPHAFEKLAYRLQQPAKRRKTIRSRAGLSC